MTIIVIVILAILIIALRKNIREDSERSGLDICPQCHKKMEMGTMARYKCPHCGWSRGHGYF